MNQSIFPRCIIQIIASIIDTCNNQRHRKSIRHNFSGKLKPNGNNQNNGSIESGLSGKILTKQFVKKPDPKTRDEQINKTTIPMLITKKFGNKINQIIKQGKLHASDASFFACYINSWEKYIVINFQKISGNHRNSSLPPIVANFQGRISNPDQSDYKKENYPESDISE